MKRFRNLVLAAAGGFALAGVARADTTQLYTSNIINDRTTNFTDSLTIQKFDPLIGTLLSVDLILYGDVNGTIKVESDDDSPTTVTASLGSRVTMYRPDNSALVVTLPTYLATRSLSAFDGADDYGGTSGFTLTGVSNSASNEVLLSNASDLALFTGSGTLTSVFKAAGNSTTSGAGNVSQKFITAAGGYATVQYTYSVSAVPEPASWLMMIAGFGLLGGALRRTRSGAVSFR